MRANVRRVIFSLDNIHRDQIVALETRRHLEATVVESLLDPEPHVSVLVWLALEVGTSIDVSDDHFTAHGLPLDLAEFRTRCAPRQSPRDTLDDSRQKDQVAGPHDTPNEPTARTC